ncbi:MAG TPA: methyltransferase domain-containing protein [Chitinophagales bacterium]|nr:methyltransferase domain-containing protein [Chitinophagales bacterium]
MQTAINLNYGQAQYLLSERMQAFPALSKFLNQTVGYTNIGNYARAKVFRKHLSKLDLASVENVLDLGCGYGENAIMVSQALRHAKITALDIDTRALGRVRHAQQKLELDNMTVHEGKIDTLKEEQFDLIYSVDVFEHIEESEMPFAECRAKLKQGGRLLVKIPNKVQRTFFEEKYFAEHNEWVDHEHPGQVYFLKDLEARFWKEGFKVVFAEQTDGLLARLAWELAYFAKKGGSLLQLASLPVCKLLINLDLWAHPTGSNQGNAITVIGQKI